MANFSYILSATTRNCSGNKNIKLHLKRNYGIITCSVVPTPVNHNNRRNNVSNRIQCRSQLSNHILINARYMSKNLSSIPEIPDAPTIVEKAGEILASNGEPTFASLGLAGWSPAGLVQKSLEFFHVTLDLPWWGAILLGTAIVRITLFPLVILAQRNAAKMNNHLPEIQYIQQKMTEARQSGNAFESSKYAQEMMLYMKEKELSPLRNVIVPLAQAPIFVSFFIGLRGMTNVPVESLHQGGLYWFTDLTISDPFYLLPIMTAATMFLTIEIGTDSARLQAQNMQLMQYFLRALPIIILPFMINFPSAILLYWTGSNFISLIQVSFLKIDKVRTFFKIDKLINHNPSALPMKKKGFVVSLKDAWRNMKITKQLQERQVLDEISFAKAGKGGLIKTYKYDPTKQHQTSNVIHAKKPNL